MAECGRVQQVCSFVGGSLTLHAQQWNELQHVSSEVQRWVTEGVSLPYSDDIESFEYKNRRFSDKEYAFVKQEIANLVKSKCVVVCESRPKCVSPLTVVPKRGNSKYRLVLDLRKVNEQTKPPKFVYEDINSVLEFTSPGDNLITLDLCNGFHHIKVQNNLADLLGFQFENTYYKFVTLVFGLSWSPYFFAKTIRAVVQHLRENNVKVVAYVDDFCVVDSPDNIVATRAYILSELKSLGFFVNYEKSSLEPETRKKYIGYIIDTGKSNNSVWLEIPNSRIRKVKHDISRVLRKGCVTARGLARIAGQLISMSKAIIPAKLLLRNIYRLLASRSSWSEVLTIDIHSSGDLDWWRKNLTSWNGRFLCKYNAAECVQVATDASKLAWGVTY